MRLQNVCEVRNLDYEATCEKILATIPGSDTTTVGRSGAGAGVGAGPLRFKLPETEILVLIWGKSPPYKLQVIWNNIEEAETYVPKLKSLLIPVEGRQVVLKPLHINIVNKILYPGPVDFVLAWWREKVLYIAPKLFIKGMMINSAFGVLWWFEWMCLYGTVGPLLAGVLSFLLVEIVWEHFQRKFGEYASLAEESSRHL